MNISCDRYKGIVYIPTSYAIRSGFYYEDAPIEIAAVDQTENLQHAIRIASERGNPPITEDEVRERLASKKSAYLKATRARSWHKLDRERAGLWSFVKKNGLYQVRIYRPKKPRGWSEDSGQRLIFPSETSANEAIARLVEMIQERYQQETTGIVVS